jgi:hypothetical protein
MVILNENLEAGSRDEEEEE